MKSRIALIMVFTLILVTFSGCVMSTGTVSEPVSQTDTDTKADEEPDQNKDKDSGDAATAGKDVYAKDSEKEEINESGDDISEGEIEAVAEDILSKMTTEQKLAQMMVVTLRSNLDDSEFAQELSGDYSDLFTKYDFGGVILYKGNIVDADQTFTMINDIQKAALNSELAIPMFVCVDQEGGIVNRVSYGSVTSGNMALTATGEVSNAKESGKIIGSELSALGFNVDFAPVCDVNSNPNNPIIGVRSFSDDPDIVSEYLTAFMEGIQDYNIITALKHFPGHGDVDQDSHTGLPKSMLTKDKLMECELLPFKAGIEKGADMIMTAHIQYPEIETQTCISKLDGEEIFLPATLSEKILTGILRDELGYNGIIITDAVDMDAIATHFDRTEAAEMAINAGADILLCSMNLYKGDEHNTLANEEAFFQSVVKSAEEGKIDAQRIDESVLRILKLKLKRNIMDITLENIEDESAKESLSEVGSVEKRQAQWDITKQAVTLLKNDDVLPFDGTKTEKTLVLYPSDSRKASVEYSIDRLKEEGLVTDTDFSLLLYDELTASDDTLNKELEESDNIIIMSQSATRNEELVKIIDMAHESGKKVLLLSLNLPYDAACYENADAVLCAYQAYGTAYDEEGRGPFNLNVAVAFCMSYGEAVPQGTLPVNIPTLISKDDGEYEFSDTWLYERGSGFMNWGK
ncbi:MAG: hypothetical protein K6B28_09890 [Lachnospiraceae bacterium]|nr:hypothetical protein [Lachnospiraceae bacterium]